MYDRTQLKALGLPNLTLQRSKRTDGSVRTVIKAEGKTVGQIAGAFGTISFNDDFSARYPQLRDYVVALESDQCYHCYQSATAAAPTPETEAASVAETDGVAETDSVANADLDAAADAGAETEVKAAPVRDVGATLLLANLARSSGLEATLAQLSSPTDACGILQLVSALSQQEVCELCDLAPVSATTFLGPHPELLSEEEINELMDRTSALITDDLFFGAVLKAKLSADLAQGSFTPFAFWSMKLPLGASLLLLSDYEHGSIYYSTIISREMLTPEDYAQCSKLLVQVMRAQLKELGHKFPQSKPLPWPLIALFEDYLAVDNNLSKSLQRKLALNYRVSSMSLRFQSYLDYGASQELSQAAAFTVEGQTIRALPLPPEICPQFLQRNRTPYPITFYLYFDQAQYDAFYLYLIAEVEAALSQITQHGISSDMGMYLATACISYDNLSKSWVLNAEGCRKQALQQSCWVQATTLPYSAEQTYRSSLLAQRCSDFLYDHQYPEDYRAIFFSPDFHPDGLILVQLYALSLFQALSARALAALSGAFGRHPDTKEQELLTDPEALLQRLSTITGRWAKGKLTITKLSAEHQALLELLGFELKPNAQGQLCYSWDECCQLAASN